MIRCLFHILVSLLAVAVALPVTAPAQTVDLLPDLVIRKNDLYDHDVLADDGRRWLRVSNGTANTGDGPLFLFGDRTAGSDSLLPIKQRIRRSDSSSYDRLSGNFIFHPTHDHIHVDDWAIFYIRELLPGDSIGDIVVTGPKQSYCVFDGEIYDNTLPNFNPQGEFLQCFANVQGLSVGWLDVYTKDLPGQQIDITNLPDGVYWLEAVVDPENRIVEIDESNNVERIKLLVGNPTDFPPDRFEPNDSLAQVLSRPVGGPNSPLLGPCDPVTQVSGSIHRPDDRDLFRFYVADRGGTGSRLRLTYDRNQGDLDLRLLDDTGTVVKESSDNDSDELIELAGLPAGWYYADVYSYLDDLSPEYSLEITPPTTDPATVTFIDGPMADTVLHGLETYRVYWETDETDNAPAWVSVYVNTVPQFDGRELLLPTSINIDAAAGFYQINSAYLDFDSYYVYLEITNGGARSGVWSTGTVTLVQAGNPGAIAGQLVDRYDNPISDAFVTTVVPSAEDSSTLDGGFLLSNLAPTRFDIAISHPEYHDTIVTDLRVLPDSTISRPIVLWELCSDLIGDIAPPTGSIDIADALFMVDYLWRDSAAAPDSLQANVDGSADGELTIADLSFLLLYLFRDGAPPVCPTHAR